MNPPRIAQVAIFLGLSAVLFVLFRFARPVGEGAAVFCISWALSDIAKWLATGTRSTIRNGAKEKR
jgi:hypothetical protein